MPARKAPPVRTAPIIPVHSDPDGSDFDVHNKLLDDVEVKSLSVDENFDSGGDPYNRTGQFAVLKKKKLSR